MQARGCTGLSSMADSEPIPAGLVSGSLVTVTGSGWESSVEWRHAGGREDWLVHCLCGTTDDDGERMITCDTCGMWMHTRCNGIPEDDPELPGFVCGTCAKRHGIV